MFAYSPLQSTGAIDWSGSKAGQLWLPAVAVTLEGPRRFAEGGLEEVLRDRPQAHRHQKLDDRGEAHLIALA